MIRIVIYEYFRLKICGRSPFNDSYRNIRIFSSQKRPHIKRKRSQKRPNILNHTVKESLSPSVVFPMFSSEFPALSADFPK